MCADLNGRGPYPWASADAGNLRGMATMTLAGTGARFPAGTTVAAYPAAQVRLGQAPSGSAVASAVAGADSVVFAGLASGRSYAGYALVGGEHRYVQFRTDDPAAAGEGGGLGLETFDQPGVLSVGVGVGRLRFPVDVVILEVAAIVDTAPTGAAIVVDVNKVGTTIFTAQGNRPSIAAGANSSQDAEPDVTAVAAGEWLTCDIDQVGSSVPGSNLTVAVQYAVV